MQAQLVKSQERLKDAKQNLADLEAGNPPDWWVNRHDQSRLGLFSGLSTRIASFAYVQPGATKEEIEQADKKYQQHRWEQDALSAESEKKIAIDIAKGYEQNSIDYNSKQITELKSKLESYQVEPSIFEWRRDLISGATIEDHLTRRLIPLGIKAVSLDSPVAFAEAIENLSDEFGVNFSFWYTRNNWCAKVSNGTHSFTRKISMWEWDGGHIYAFAYALLDYIEHQWDTLIELAEQNEADN